MQWTQGSFSFSALSLLMLAFGAQGQPPEPTMVILPENAADQAKIMTEDIVLPDEAADGMATAEANRGGADAAADGLAEAQLNANEAAEQGLQTAMDAVEGARGDLGRANIPDGLPEGVPENIPAVPEGTLPEGTDLPTPPAPPTPPFGT